MGLAIEGGPHLDVRSTVFLTLLSVFIQDLTSSDLRRARWGVPPRKPFIFNKSA